MKKALEIPEAGSAKSAMFLVLPHVHHLSVEVPN